MRNNFIIYLLVVVSIHVFGQDSIYFRNGEIKVAKVEEVGVNEIKYHRFNYLEGPVFVSSKNDISKIRYAAGNVDLFKVNVETQNAPSVNAGVLVGKLSLYRGTRFMFNGVFIGNNELEAVIQRCTDNELRNKLLQKKAEADGYKRKSHNAVAIGAAVGFPLPAIGVAAGLFLGETSYVGPSMGPIVVVVAGGILIGAAVRITAAVQQKVNQNKAAHAREELVKLYNNGK